MDQIDATKRELLPRFAVRDIGTKHKISRGFHLLGLFLAGALALVILAGAAIDFVQHRLWEVRASELPVVAGMLLVAVLGYGLVCVALYLLVRAFGWVVGKVVVSKPRKRATRSGTRTV
jgi:hypothetical protein